MKYLLTLLLSGSVLYAQNLYQGMSLYQGMPLITTPSAGGGSSVNPGVDSGGNGDGDGATGFSYSFTSSSSGLLMVVVGAYTTTGTGALAYDNGQAMSPLVTNTWVLGGGYMTVFYLTNSVSGSHTIGVTNSAAPAVFSSCAVLITNASQTASFGTIVEQDITIGPGITNVATCGVGNFVVDFVGEYSGVVAYVPTTTPQTIYQNYPPMYLPAQVMISGIVSTGTNQSMGWYGNYNAFYGQIIVPIKH